MQHEIIQDGVRFIPVGLAARNLDRSKPYLMRLCRSGSIRSRKIGNEWYVDEAQITDFVAKQESIRSKQYELIRYQRSEEYRSHQGAMTVVAPSELREVRQEGVRKTSAYASYAVSMLIVAGLLLTVYAATDRNAAQRMANIIGSMPASGTTQVAAAAEGSGVLGVVSKAARLWAVAVDHALAALLPNPVIVQKNIIPEKTQPITQTVINNTYNTTNNNSTQNTYTTKEVVSPPQQTDGVSEATIDSKIADASNSLRAEIYRIGVPSSGGISNNVAISQRIDHLASARIENSDWTGGTISGAAISGGSISGSSLNADTLNAGSTSLATTTVSGDLTVTGNFSFGGTLSLSDTTFANSTSTRFFSSLANFDQATSTYLHAGSFTSSTSSITSLTSTHSTSTTLYSTSGSFGLLSLGTALSISNGGTGTSTAPAYGQVLVGNALGGYDLLATSSLGILGGGGSGSWGAITGNLSDQTDLQAALDAKLSLTNWYATTTSALAEGSNLYFTNARADARVAAGIAATTTDALAQGSTNKYYSTALFTTDLGNVSKGFFFSTTSTDYWKTQNNFFSTTSMAFWEGTQWRWATSSSDHWLTTKSTSDIAEGSNLYFTTNRVAGVLAGTTTDALAQGSVNKYWSNTLFDARLSATTSLPNVTTLSNLASIGTLSALAVAGNTTLANATSTNFFSTVASSTNLFAQSASFGSISFTNTLGVSNGGTGANSFSYGLVGSSGGTGALTNFATSTLGLLTTDVAEGTNKYWTDIRFDNRLSSTTTLPNLTTLANLSTVGTITSGTWSGLFGAVSGANLTNLTPANISAGTAGINVTGNAGTATALQTGRTINGTTFDGTGNIVITAASSTLLANSNTWTAIQLFSAGASTTNFSNFGTAYFGGTATSSFSSTGQLNLANQDLSTSSVLTIDGTQFISASSSAGNTFVGLQSGASITTGTLNSGFGYLSLFKNTTGSVNTAMGYQALYNNTTGSNNSASGYAALYNNTSGAANVANGRGALYNNSSGNFNVAIGYQALLANTGGSSNIANGYQALSGNVNGSYNVVSGQNALVRNTGATGIVAFGHGVGAGTSNYSNQGGTYIGYQSGTSLSTGSDYNTLLGYQSGYGITTGSNNLLLSTATSSTAIANLTTGSQNILIGNNISLPSATASGQLNIGNILYGTGITGTGSTVSSGNIGIGTTSPWQTLTVKNSGAVGSVAIGGLPGAMQYGAIYLNGSQALADYNIASSPADLNLYFNRPTGRNMYFNENTSPQMSILSGGNVGIGTSSPQGILHTNMTAGTDAAAPKFFADAATVGQSAEIMIGQSMGNYRTGMLRYTNGAGTAGSALFQMFHYGDSAASGINILGGGNVGIGTTTPQAPLVVTGGSSVKSAVLLDSSNVGGGNIWGLRPGVSGISNAYFGIVNETAGTTPLIINTSGDVGIGANPGTRLDVQNNVNSAVQIRTYNANAGSSAYVQNYIQTNDGALIMQKGSTANGGAGYLYHTGSGPMYMYTSTATSLNLGTNNNAARMIIGSNGRVGIGADPSTAGQLQVHYAGNTVWGIDINDTTGTASVRAVNISSNGTSVGSITNSGSATAFNTTSDRRLKENIGDTTTGLDTLLQIPVRNFDYKTDPLHTQTQGFIAQELQPLYPFAVTTNGDNGLDALGASSTPWQVDYGRITPLLAKAIQDIALLTDTFRNKLIAWLSDAANGIGDVFANTFRAKERICVDDQCLTKDDVRVLLQMAHAQGAVGNPASESGGGGDSQPENIPTPQASSTPPVISINGANPTSISVGTSYADLGATITGPTQADTNLGIHVFLDGAEQSGGISLDTSAPGTHTIDYIATNAAGTATSTRSVIVNELVQNTADTE